jgi:hypothetical protein
MVFNVDKGGFRRLRVAVDQLIVVSPDFSRDEVLLGVDRGGKRTCAVAAIFVIGVALPFVLTIARKMSGTDLIHIAISDERGLVNQLKKWRELREHDSKGGMPPVFLGASWDACVSGSVRRGHSLSVHRIQRFQKTNHGGRFRQTR